MEIRKKIIYGIFAVSVVYGFYFHVIREDGDARGPSTEVKHHSSPVIAANPSGLGTAPLEGKPTTVDDSAIDWSRDPFRSRRAGRGPEKNNVVNRRKLTPPRLTAVSRSAGKNMAVVDGRIIEVGSKIGPWRLIRITDNAALFEGPDGQIWVKLGG